MAGETSLLMAEIAETRRRVAGTSYPGVVVEVKGDRVRVQWGEDSKGQPVLSPWLETANHRGGATERRYYKKGQNVVIQTVNGQMDEAATVSADAPNEDFPAPDQAEDEGQESETYQFDELRVTKTAKKYQVYFGKDAKIKILIEEKGRITILADEQDGLVTIKTSKKVMIETPLVEVQAKDKVLVETQLCEIKAKNKVSVETPVAEFSKDVRVRGNVTALGEVTGRGIRLSTHRHVGVETGRGTTGPPT